MSFTIEEYITQNALGVDIHDSGATKLVAAHLRKIGYESRRVRKDGRARTVWMKSAREADMAKLEAKLAELEVKAKKEMKK